MKYYLVIAKDRWNSEVKVIDSPPSQSSGETIALFYFREHTAYSTAVVLVDTKKGTKEVVSKITRNCECKDLQFIWESNFTRLRLRCTNPKCATPHSNPLSPLGVEEERMEHASQIPQTA